MSSRGRASLLLIAAFVLGLVVGALGMGLYVAQAGGRLPLARAESFPSSMLRRLSRELDLRPDQRERVEAVLQETGQEFSRLRDELRPRFRDIRARSRDRIRALLDREQQADFERLSTEWERRAEQRRR
jgi:hypothetical protein